MVQVCQGRYIHVCHPCVLLWGVKGVCMVIYDNSEKLTLISMDDKGQFMATLDIPEASWVSFCSRGGISREYRSKGGGGGGGSTFKHNQCRI